MTVEYDILETSHSYCGLAEYHHVRHKVDGHEAIYCLHCRVLTRVEGPWERPGTCPKCGTGWPRWTPRPEPVRPPQENINPMTGQGDQGGRYKMVHDWDRGWVWTPDIGMK